MFSKNLKIFITAILSISLLFIAGSFVFSQDLEINYPTINGEQPLTTNTYLPSYIKYIFNFAVIACGLIVLAIIITAGSRYVSSRGNPSVNRAAREQIVAGLTGLLILLSSYVLLSTINPKLTFFNLGLLTSDRTAFQPISNLDIVATTTANELPLGVLVNNKNSITGVTYSAYKGILNSKRLEGLKKTGKATEQANLKLEELVGKLRDESFKLKDLGLTLRTQGINLKKFSDKCACNDINCSSNCSVSAPNTCSSCNSIDCLQITVCSDCAGDTCPDRNRMNELININIPDTVSRINAQQLIVEEERQRVRLFAGAINAFLSKDATVEAYEAANSAEIIASLSASTRDLISKADRSGMKEVEQDYGSPQKIKEDLERDLNSLQEIEMTIKLNPFSVVSYYSFIESKEMKTEIEQYRNGEIDPGNDPATFYFLE